eukprot:7329029-Ditylum_brightwellii.AAC.1
MLKPSSLTTTTTMTDPQSSTPPPPIMMEHETRPYKRIRTATTAMKMTNDHQSNEEHTNLLQAVKH